MKTIDRETQDKIVAMVNKGNDKEAYQLECELSKDRLLLIECVDRLKQAQRAGEICYGENMATPKWVNNHFLEQCFTSGWKFKQVRS